jgi:NAD(P)-dependent dehydrogenase (short-subunit alcohol dehydrogenase family)
VTAFRATARLIRHKGMNGRVAIITGAGRGIGREEALFFAARGARVVVNDPGVASDGSGGDPDVARRVVEEIRAMGGQAVASTASVADWSGARELVETAVEAFGDLDIVVNNATIERTRALAVMTEEDFDSVVAVKLKGSFAVSHWAARHWAGGGEVRDRAIVNTASGSGLTNPLPGQTNYAAANAAVAAMTVVHALELGRYGVRVNCLSPSMVRTRLTGAVPGELTPPAAVAPVAAYLASSGCPLNGQVLSVRGGSVTVNRGWSAGERVEAEGGLWTVEELARALADVPFTDPAEQLAAALRGALGGDGARALERLIDGLN